jgi:HTH-type transcriptional regulator / antitoxin HigA
MEKAQWYLIETEEEYEKALTRYDEVKYAAKGSEEHKEKMLLVHLICQYESLHDIEVEVDPVEVIKIRMEDFGYKPADLAQVYVSKVLNYKQALSLSMIRKFSQLLRIPAELLIKEYSLKGV